MKMLLWLQNQLIFIGFQRPNSCLVHNLLLISRLKFENKNNKNISWGIKFMDIRETIIEAVTSALQTKVEVDESIIDIVQDVLIFQLNKYEVQERCTDLVPQDTSSEKLLKRFIATKKVEGIAENTLRRYYDENNRLIHFIQKPIHEITTYDIRFYLSYRRETKKVSNRTLDGMRRCYSSFFNWLSAEQLIPHNPCATLNQIKYKKTVKKPFSPTELEKIRRSCDNIRDLALVDFLYSTGCRVSEIARLDLSDIDFENSEVHILGKGNKERIVYMSPVAMMNLQEYLKTRTDTVDALFLGKGSRRIGKNGIEAMLKRIGEKAEVQNVHPHRFRRTLATNLLDRGMNIQDVAAILGHADLKTTQIYCYISQCNVRNAYQKYAA